MEIRIAVRGTVGGTGGRRAARSAGEGDGVFVVRALSRVRACVCVFQRMGRDGTRVWVTHTVALSMSHRRSTRSRGGGGGEDCEQGGGGENDVCGDGDV